MNEISVKSNILIYCAMNMMHIIKQKLAIIKVWIQINITRKITLKSTKNYAIKISKIIVWMGLIKGKFT